MEFLSTDGEGAAIAINLRSMRGFRQPHDVHILGYICTQIPNNETCALLVANFDISHYGLGLGLGLGMRYFIHIYIYKIAKI